MLESTHNLLDCSRDLLEQVWINPFLEFLICDDVLLSEFLKFIDNSDGEMW